MSATLRYGVLGGSFDPPHYGHLALAETARAQLGLARVLFVPAGQPPHKAACSLAPQEQRMAMVAAAIADNAAFELSRVDVERPGPHYTVDMLRALRTSHPQVDSWFFLMGEDSLYDLPHWRDVDAILEQASLAVMPRSGKRVDVNTLVPAVRERLVWLDVPLINFSATMLRRRVREGLPLRYLVPPSVETYIAAQYLYRSVGGSS